MCETCCWGATACIPSTGTSQTGLSWLRTPTASSRELPGHAHFFARRAKGPLIALVVGLAIALALGVGFWLASTRTAGSDGDEMAVALAALRLLFLPLKEP